MRIGAVAVAVAVAGMVWAGAAQAGFKNANFETGDLTGWKSKNQASSGGGMLRGLGAREVVVYDESSRNQGEFTLPSPLGTFSPSIVQEGPGRTALHQVTRVPKRAKRLTMKIFWINGNGGFLTQGHFDPDSGPNQFFSIDLGRRGMGAFSTQPAKIHKNIYSPPVDSMDEVRRDRGPGPGTTDSGGWFSAGVNVRKLRGKRVRLRLAEVDNGGYLYVGIDRIRFTR